jgi:hypothetical protein
MISIGCMKFIDVLLENSSLKQARLYRAAKKASEDPSIGITINNPAASHVIKDSALIAISYIPLFIFSSYDNPFEQLKGKFVKEDIVEFINASKTELSFHQLLIIMLEKVKRVCPEICAPKKVQLVQTNSDVLMDDPYGDYYAEKVQVEVKEKTIEEVLCEAFGC